MKKTNKNSEKPTASELELLGSLWERGPSTVRELHEGGNGSTGYTTTLKTLQNMTEKGFVLRDTSERTHVYRVAEKLDGLQRGLVGDLMRKAFGGRPGKLVLHALSEQAATPEELNEIRELLEKLRQEQGEKK